MDVRSLEFGRNCKHGFEATVNDIDDFGSTVVDKPPYDRKNL